MELPPEFWHKNGVIILSAHAFITTYFIILKRYIVSGFRKIKNKKDWFCTHIKI